MGWGQVGQRWRGFASVVAALLTTLASASPGGEAALAEGLRLRLLEVWQREEAPARWVDEARLLYYLGNALPRDRSEDRLGCFDAGQQAAERARQASPDSAGARFWWVANLAGRADMERNLWALGALRTIERELLALIQTHPEFGFGASQRVLASIYQAAPRIISVGSTSRAEAQWRHALAVGPRYPGNWAGWARFLREEERWEELVEALKRLRELDLGGDYGDFWPETREWEPLLREMEASVPKPRQEGE